jgi:hypothetical protein
MHNENPKDIFFHVGLARAASAYLQHKVFPHFTGVHYIPPNHYRRYQHIIAATTAPKYLVSREFDQRLACESRQFAHAFLRHASFWSCAAMRAGSPRGIANWSRTAMPSAFRNSLILSPTNWRGNCGAQH